MNKMIIVDTDILIDACRGRTDAIAYLENLERTSSIAISAITEMELLAGNQNKRELVKTEKFLDRFTTLSLNEKISSIAIDLLKTYRLSHGLEIADGIIAATAIYLQFPFVSKNQRDYRFIEDLNLIPYP